MTNGRGYAGRMWQRSEPLGPGRWSRYTRDEQVAIMSLGLLVAVVPGFPLVGLIVWLV
jgi:hypothetical protein